MNAQPSHERLVKLLAEQYDFLAASAARFDTGYEHEWKRLAIALRVLLHDTSASASLLGQLGIKDTLDFLDSDAGREPEPGRQLAYPRGWPMGFVGTRLGIGVGATFFPMLDNDLEMPRGRLPFADWWRKRLLDSPHTNEHWRRQDFVLGATNKEGGAHVDPTPPAWWTDLRDGTWVGAATTTGPDGSQVPMVTLVPAVIRQIAYEVTTTLQDAGLGSRPAKADQGDSGAIVASASLEVPVPAGRPST
jgi:hypothetical protein